LWGGISGKYGRYKGLFWEKDWATINKGSYSGIIVPIVQEILQQFPDLQFQQDNTKGDYIERHYLEVYRSYKRLREVI
jgi:hypothetical protein